MLFRSDWLLLLLLLRGLLGGVLPALVLPA
jgi:hypothetical protein